MLLVGLATAIFWQTADHEFINFDDNSYVSENRFVLQGLTLESLSAAFTRTFNGHCHPATMISYMADTALFGTGPAGYHFTNAFLHALNGVLLFFLLIRMTGLLGPSLFAAALFAAHPLHVEPVAWIASRKDMLSTFFFLLSLMAYAGYAANPNRRRYAAVGLWLLLGLLSKAILVTAPAVLLLLDIWPLKRIDLRASWTSRELWRRAARLFAEKLPLFAIVAVFAFVTVYTQSQAGTMSSFNDLTLGARISNAVEAYGVYLRKTLWPVNLAPFYPHDGIPIPFARILPLLAAYGGIALAAALTIRLAPYLLFGCFYFAGTLLPVSGLLQAGIQAYADRYTYLSLIGLFVAAAFGANDLSRRWNVPKPLPLAAGSILILALAAVSFTQTGHWKNDEALFAHALRVTEDNYVAHMILGNAYQTQGRTDEAIREYEAALAIEPNDAGTHVGLAIARFAQGDAAAAAHRYRTAMELDPGQIVANTNLGVILLRQGQLSEAAAHLERALSSNPECSVALNGFGEVRMAEGELAAALALFERGLELDPEDATLLTNAGQAYAGQRDHERALPLFRRVLDNAASGTVAAASAHYNYGVALAQAGRFPEAIAAFEATLAIDPAHKAASDNLRRAREGH